MSKSMTDEELLGYFEIHSRNEGPRFSRKHVERLFKLAGSPPGYMIGTADMLYVGQGTADELVRLARGNMSKVEPKPTIEVIHSVSDLDLHQRFGVVDMLLAHLGLEIRRVSYGPDEWPTLYLEKRP